MINERMDLGALLEDLDGGVFVAKISKALKDAAIGAIVHKRKGQVVVSLDLSQIGNSNQVEMKHKVKFVVPTKNGNRAEEDTTSTPLHVGQKGNLTLVPETQGGFNFNQED